MDSFDVSQRPETKGLSKSTNSKRVQNRVHNSEVGAELQQIIDAWPDLNNDQIRRILEIIKSK